MPAHRFRNEKFIWSLSNHSSTPILHNRIKYHTPEHMFQATKFRHRPDIIQAILSRSSPRHAINIARRHAGDVHHRWEEQRIAMLEVVFREKFLQHHFLLHILLGTQETDLELVSADTYWGTGWNRDGSNLFGQTLAKMRAKFRDEIQRYYRLLPAPVVLPPPPRWRRRKPRGPMGISCVVM